MLTIALFLLLVFGVSLESPECPLECTCITTRVNPDQQMLLAAVTTIKGTLFISEEEQESLNAGNASEFSKLSAYPSKANFKENAGSEEEEMFTYQITCDGLRDLGPRSLMPSLPKATTQLIIRGTRFESVDSFYWTLRTVSLQLTELTDFSLTSSRIKEKELRLLAEGDGHQQIMQCKLFQILNLSNNSLMYLPLGLFSRCECLQTLDLSNNKITNLDDEIFHPLINLLRLDLHSNNLKWLSEGIFRNLTKLLTLDISHNAVSKVSPSTFQYLTNLNTLIIADNPFKFGLALLGIGKRLHFVNASKTGLKKIPSTLERSVRDLKLTDNFLTSIQCGDLDSYPFLSSLNLNRNKISFIEDDAIGRLESLKNLQLSQNKLFQVPKSLPNALEILNLSHNMLQNISKNDFSNLSLLKELSLSNNHIMYVEKNSFINLSNLEVLDLSKNPLVKLNPLLGLTKLKILNLSYCLVIPTDWRKFYQSFPTPTPSSIEILHLDSSPLFAELFLEDTATLQLFTNITHLFIRFSNLTTLRKDIFELLPKLDELRLEGNPWHCDREIIATAAWLRSHLKSTSTNTDNGLNTVHCATPSKLYKKLLRTITFEDFDVPMPFRTFKVEKVESIPSVFFFSKVINRTLTVSTTTRTAAATAAAQVTFLHTSTEISARSTIASEIGNATDGFSFEGAAAATSRSEKSQTVQSSRNSSTSSDSRPTLETVALMSHSESSFLKKNLDYAHPLLLVLMFVSSVMVITLGLTLLQMVKARQRHREILQFQAQEMEIQSISTISNDLW